MRKIEIILAMCLLCLGAVQAGVKYVPEYVIEGAKGQQLVYDPVGTPLEN